jgi:hypothetical protein
VLKGLSVRRIFGCAWQLFCPEAKPGRSGDREGAASIDPNRLRDETEDREQAFHAELKRRQAPVLSKPVPLPQLPSSHLFAEFGKARTEAAQCIDLLLQRESTVEDEAARAGKAAHLMRLYFIYAQFKLVPLESSYSRSIFAYSSPQLL